MTTPKKLPTAVICFSPGAGGMELDAIRVARIISGQTKVYFVCKKGSFAEKNCKEILDEYPIELFTVDFISKAFSINIIFSVRALVKKNKIKNIIFFGASELKSLFFSFIGLGLNITVKHVTTKNRHKKDILHRLVYSNVKHYVGLSAHLVKNIYKILPVREQSQVHLIYPSFNFQADKRKLEKRTYKVIDIICLARMAKGKGQLDAVKACSILFDNDIKFSFKLLGGYDKDDYYEEVKEAISDLPNSGEIEILGYVDDVNVYLEKADIFLFPSHGEGCPLSFNEALASGLVCIAYDNTVFPELKENGFYFHLAEDRNIKQLSQVLLNVCNNIESELNQAEGNIVLARKIYDEKRELGQWLELLV